MKKNRIEYDVTYLCFLSAAAPQLMILIAENIIIPSLSNPEQAVGFVWIGFYLLLLAVGGTVIWILLTLIYHGHWPLWLLAVLNLSYFPLFLWGDHVSSALSTINLLVIVAICARWFLVVRQNYLPEGKSN